MIQSRANVTADAIIEPQPGPQRAFLATPADIAIYGGAAGGGKTWALLLEPLRHMHNSGFGAVMFRRTYPQVMNEGGLWDESLGLYSHVQARPVESRLEWRFPSGSTVKFAHMQHEKNKLDWQGSQIALICWDELTHFTEGQFFYMLSRNRSTCGVRPYIRATCNPDAASWVARFINWWLADDGYANMDKAGRLRYFVRASGKIEWADTAEELAEQFPHLCKDAPPKSVTFIPASVYDNPALLKKDPGYLANLMALLPVDQARLLGDRKRGGNWKTQAGGGDIFDRDWFEIISAEELPSGGVECRFWDFAASEYKENQEDKPYTAGVAIRSVGKTYFVTDCIAVQEGPAKADETFVSTSRADRERMRSHTAYRVRWEIEPGSAGKKENYRLITMMDGFDAHGTKPQGDKFVRAKPFAIQAKAGNVKIVRGAWNEDYLQHLHNQPDWPVQDIMDASSGAYLGVNEVLRSSRLVGSAR